jgi:hypothetical protein
VFVSWLRKVDSAPSPSPPNVVWTFIEEYGGRYERDVRARITFADWVVAPVRDMVEFADSPANQLDNDGGK